jgi:ATP-dependent RNA helicase RhlE
VTHFNGLGLAAPLLKALDAKGYSVPTPIQIQAIPPVLAGRDLVGLAQTGTGKTAAFALPILDRLAADRRHAGARACRALVLAPTRELAVQIAESFRAYGRFIGLSTAIVYGGVALGRQIAALERGVDILVATPGRLLDLIERRACRLDAVEILVLDEADHMLDLGFIHALKRIARLLPVKRQSLFFSATMPAPIAELSAAFLTDPVRVAVAAPAATAERVSQGVIHVEAARKQALLRDLLRDARVNRALVFTRTKHGANRVVKRLAEEGVEAAIIHGNKSQGQRERALDAFKRGRARLLVATEIAARGIDISDVSHVINFDLPDVPEQYVHRIGRTARAGAGGAAISFCAPEERGNLRAIERLIGQAVPALEHDLGIAAPTPDRPARATPRPPKQGGKRAGNNRAKPNGGQETAELARHRKRNGLWSNAAPRRAGRQERQVRPRGK